MVDPPIISLDIETFGACEKGWRGKDLPLQTTFHPRRSLYTDEMNRNYDDLILSVAITIPKFDPRPADHTGHGWDLESVAALEPGETMVFEMNKLDHRLELMRWLCHADTLIGQNIKFDLKYLRILPLFRQALSGRHTLLELSVVNFLQSELRPERGLKALSALLQTHKYGRTLADGRFPSPQWVDPDDGSNLLNYNAQDTHATMLCLAELARRILKDHPPCPPPSPSNGSITGLPSGSSPSSLESSSVCSPAVQSTTKLSPACIQHYSDEIWSCIRIEEAGIPMSRSKVERLHVLSARWMDVTKRRLKRRFDLLIEGKGTVKSRTTFLESLIHDIDQLGLCRLDPLVSGLPVGARPSILDHPLLELTKKKKAVSWMEMNRNLLESQLPTYHPYKEALSLITKFTRWSKLRSTFTQKLLFHRSKHPEDRRDVLIPPPPLDGRNFDTFLGYPDIFLVPSNIKDTEASESGGQKQARLSFKHPAAATFPPPLKACFQSRWLGGVICGFDLSQIELRTPAILSGDPLLVRNYMAGEDLHIGLAIECEGRGVTKNPAFGKGDGRADPRQWYKQGNFLILYRGGAEKYQKTILKKAGHLLDADFCQRLVENLRRLRAGLWAWQEKLLADAHRDGRIELPILGLSRYFLGGEDWDENEIVNFPVQAWAALVMLQIQIEVFKRLASLAVTDASILPFLNWYDACYFDCRTSAHVDELRTFVAEAVTWVQDHGLWHQLSQLYGHYVPLSYEFFPKDNENA